MALYAKPANLFVAGFIGSPGMNVLPGHAEAGRVTVQGVTLDAGVPDGPVTLGVRGEELALCAPGAAPLTGRIVLIERLGGQSLTHMELPDGTMMIAQSSGNTDLAEGETAGIDLAASPRHLFDARGERIGD